jgi:hypothetical protein
LKTPETYLYLLRGQKQNMERFIFSPLSYKIRQTISSYTPSKTRYNKSMLNPPKLPIEEVVYLSTLTRSEMESRLRALWKAGWSLGVIGSSLSPAVPKTTIHFWVRRALDVKQLRALPLPPPKSLTTSVPTKHAPRLRSVSPGVPPELRIKLRELSALSKRYRAKTSPTSPLAQANNELTQIARQLKNRGVPTAAIAEAAGVTYRAMARRLSQ